MTISQAPRANPDILTSGEEAFDRSLINNTSVAALTSGRMRLAYFTAQRSEAITQLEFLVGATAAGATPTLVRYGVYDVASNGDGTLVASTANDTSLLAATNTAYAKALSSTWNKERGRRYAVGALVVTGAAMPTLLGIDPVSATVLDGILGRSPRLSGLLISLTDLPSSFVAASTPIFDDRRRHYCRMIP